jgi:hypothetical protein
MAQSLAKILVHTVFSTKDQRPFMRDELNMTNNMCGIDTTLSGLREWRGPLPRVGRWRANPGLNDTMPLALESQ